MTVQTHASVGRELTTAELGLVSGGISADVGYGSSLATSAALLGGAVALVAAAPLIAGTLAVGSVVASVGAIYWGTKDDES